MTASIRFVSSHLSFIIEKHKCTSTHKKFYNCFKWLFVTRKSLKHKTKLLQRKTTKTKQNLINFHYSWFGQYWSNVSIQFGLVCNAVHSFHRQHGKSWRHQRASKRFTSALYIQFVREYMSQFVRKGKYGKLKRVGVALSCEKGWMYYGTWKHVSLFPANDVN